MRGYKLAALAVGVLAVAGCGGSSRRAAPPTSVSTTTTSPSTAPSSTASVAVTPRTSTAPGEVAYVTKGQLLIDANGSRDAVAGPGFVSHPAWSADGRWLAYLRSPTPPSGNGVPDSASLWLARADGSLSHQVSQVGHEVDEFAWAASSETLAFSDTASSSSGLWRLVTATPQSAPRTLMEEHYPFDLAWSPVGDGIAVTGISGNIGASGGWDGVLQIVSSSGGPVRTVYASASNALDLAGWSPDGKYLTFWYDPQGSASLASDGLTLYIQPVQGGPAAKLGDTLPYHDWVAWSPNSQEVALVTGMGRGLYEPTRTISVCRIPAATCAPVPLARGQLSMEPAWTADGSLVVARAPGGTNDGFSPPSGIGSSQQPFAASTVQAWYDAQSLWTVPGASPDQAARLAAAGTGAHSPVPTSSGLLYVNHDTLFYLGDQDMTPIRIAGSIGPPEVYASSYYAYIDWTDYLAWHG